MSEELKGPNELEKVSAVETGGKYFFTKETHVDCNPINFPPVLDGGYFRGHSRMPIHPGDIVEVLEKKPRLGRFGDDVLRVKFLPNYASGGGRMYSEGMEMWTSSSELMSSSKQLYLHKREGSNTPLSTARTDQLADPEADVKQRAGQTAEETRQLMLRVFEKKKGE